MKKVSRVACMLAMWAAVIGAQSVPSASPAPYDCTALAYDLMDCVGFLMVGGTETKPQASCCSGLKILLKANADCLCFAMNFAANLGLDVDITQARALPSSCGVADPSFSTCHVADSPHVSPASNPPPSAVGGAPAATYGVDSAPAPAPSSGSTVPPPAIFSGFVFVAIASAVLF